ncbi:MAG: aminopeptidase P N-terminal domain-containing protein [Planctomycetes bacterium]|nr:aminopeptidase P N-terminal domain-containing protein [Planctomycetota bacterium]MCH8120864.1 aminopeptidase P N-terminal domain-containing protein [Planctomycetota bacterium]
MMKISKKMAVIWLLMPVLTFAQDDFWYQRDFPPEEFAQRRGKVFEKIGTEAVALLQGAPTARGFGVFRQNNEFFYLCGIEVPQAYLLLDGRSGKTAVYLPSLSRRSKSGPTTAEYALSVKKQTGIDAVYGIESLLGHLENVSELYALLGSRRASRAPRRELTVIDRSEATDLLSRDPLGEGRFVNLIQNCFPKLAIKNLSPIIDSLRVIKSPAEIKLMRRAGKLSALAVIEAMRSTEVGVMEYQLDAVSKYIFFVNGARGEGYPSIIAGGANMWYGHYSRKDCVLNDGDIVLMDHAPDYGYYTSDIGRIWPVNGKYAPWQRELYGFMLKYHKAVIKRIRPGVTANEIMEEARTEMEEVLKNTKFSKPIYEKAARSTYGHMSHAVGMEVHDVGGSRGPLKPGMVFAVDPQMRVPEEKLYIRIEDTVVVTDDGVDILTDAAPWELDDIEKLMKEEGMLQKYPPVFTIKKKP